LKDKLLEKLAIVECNSWVLSLQCVLVPSVLVFDNAAYFSSTLLTKFSLDKGIIISVWLWIKEEIEEKGREKMKYELRGKHID
jgi:hypothetical protein